MAVVRHLLTGFLTGEISPFLFGRVETDQYRYGLASCENWIPTIEGPLLKRGGFEFIRPAAATAAWLSAFRRGVTQEYVVEWSDLKARFFTNGGRIETAPNVAYEITTPYTAAEARELCHQQNFDRDYLAHADHAPAALRRDTATTFTLETLALVDGPLADGNSDTASTVTASGTTGSVTLTASAAIFDAGQIGTPIRLEVKDFGDVPAWEAGMKAVVVGELVHNAGKVYEAVTAGITGQVQPTHSEGAYYDGQLKQDEVNIKGPYGVKWEYQHDRFGLATITSVGGGGTTATADVTRTLPDSLTSVATWRWSLGAFSAWAGWPHLVTLYKGRLIYFKDFDVVGSVVGDYGGGRVNFATHSDTGVLTDDLAFRRAISIEDPPLWVARDRKLVIGTAQRELAIGPVNTSAALSGSNIAADDQSFYGSEAVTPVQTGTETLFVERGGRRIRGADYDFARDRYDAADLTASARHVTGGGIVQLAFQRNPQAIVYAVREDGQLALHPKTRLEIKGWARTVLGGGARVLSSVAIVGEDGKGVDLWVLVERENGAGATVREVWKQSAWRELGDAQAEAFFVDGGVRISATAGQTTFTGLDHLAGQDVAVLCNGGVVGDCSVSGAGVLTLPAGKIPPAGGFTVIVGLAYTATAIGLSPEFTVPGGGSSQGLLKRLVKVTLRLIESLGLSVSVPEGPLEPIIDRPAGAAMDAPVPLVTGDYGGIVDAAFDRSGVPQWISADPVPAMVAAAMLKIETDTADD